MSGPIFSGQIPVSEISDNTNQSVIQITEDKLRLALITHLDKVERKSDWIAPFGIFLSIALTLVSTEFKTALGVPKDTWTAIFMIAGIVSLGFFIKSLKAAFKPVTIDNLILHIKQGKNQTSR